MTIQIFTYPPLSWCCSPKDEDQHQHELQATRPPVPRPIDTQPTQALPIILPAFRQGERRRREDIIRQVPRASEEIVPVPPANDCNLTDQVVAVHQNDFVQSARVLSDPADQADAGARQLDEIFPFSGLTELSNESSERRSRQQGQSAKRPKPRRQAEARLTETDTSTDDFLRISSTTSFQGARIQRWNHGNDDYKFGHHKFPRSSLSWIWSHLSPSQRATLKKELNLSGSDTSDTETLRALASLGSMVISAKNGDGRIVSSEARSDDPDGRGRGKRKHGMSLDLVRNSDGMRTPRSQEYMNLASHIASIVSNYAAENSVFSDEDFRQILMHFRNAENAHRQIMGEGRAHLPSYHGSNALWQTNSDGLFFKGNPVMPE